jgi:hypothetical protein
MAGDKYDNKPDDTEMELVRSGDSSREDLWKYTALNLPDSVA